uniref:RNA-binding protein PNO1 n=1 Tax=Peromyscus maniculatus bairdii TaxID=230844 RepID=A0A8C8UI01_PERMB
MEMSNNMETQNSGTEDGFSPRHAQRGPEGEEGQAEQRDRMETPAAAWTRRRRDLAKRPVFPPLSGKRLLTGKEETRKIPVPGNRYTPLKENWMKVFTPIVEHLGLQIHFNLKSRNVEISTCKDTKDVKSGRLCESLCSWVSGGGCACPYQAGWPPPRVF